MSVSSTAIAERLQQGGEATLCLASSDTVAAGIKKAFQGCQRLPVIIPLPRLLSAAAELAADRDAIAAAHLLEMPVTDEQEQRCWQLYEQLRPYCQDSSGRAAQLQLAQKLAQLFEEIEEQRPETDNPFADAGNCSHEWTVAAALWEVLAEEMHRKQERRRQLAAQLPPLVAVCDEDTTPAQRAFYQQCQAEILELSPPPEQQRLRAMFTTDGDPVALEDYQAAEGIGTTLTEAAQLAGDCICRFLAEAPAEQTMGIIVYDRLLARRVRAIAEAKGILITDHDGWRAESLAYGAALSVCADVLLDEFSMLSLQQVLDAPFYAKNKRLKAAAREWSQIMASNLYLPTTPAGLLKKLKADSALAEMVADIERGQQMRSRPAAALTRWVEQLLEFSQPLLAAWRRDPVAQLLQTRLRQRAAKNTLLADSEEFLLWLRGVLATESITDTAVNSRVGFSVPGTSRRFDRLLLLGYAGALVTSDNGWLGEHERQRLGLPGRSEHIEQQRRRFCRLLESHRHITAVWCSNDDGGKPVMPNPFWRVFAGECARHGRLRQLFCHADNRLAQGISLPAAAAVTSPPLPDKLSLTAADTLMACPYAFYVQYLLGLRDNEREGDDEISPMFAGSLMHQALSLFSEKSESLQTYEELQQCWQAVLDEQLRGNRPFLKLLATHWHHYSEWFINWEQQRRDQAWQTVETEYLLEATLALPGGHTMALRGRLDRFDRSGADDHTIAIIDYKSGMLPTKKVLAAGEAPQLPLYAYFLRQQLGDAAHCEKMLCRPLHREAKSVVCEADEIRMAARLRQVLRQIVAGKPIPANGTINEACVGCSAVGVCRRHATLPR